MWNFSFRPLYSDDIDMRFPEVASFDKHRHRPAAELLHGRAFRVLQQYRPHRSAADTDRSRTAPPAAFVIASASIRSWSRPSLRGYGMVRQRHIDPKIEDNVVGVQSGNAQAAARIAGRALGQYWGAAGIQRGAAAAEAASAAEPAAWGAAAAALTRTRSIRIRTSASQPRSKISTTGTWARRRCSRRCMPSIRRRRNAHTMAAKQFAPKTGRCAICTWSRRSRNRAAISTIPKRIFYIDSEGWFITASDQYDREGKLWKTIATFNTYRDRPVPDAKIAIYPYKRMFQLGLVDEDLDTGYSSVVYMPGPTAPDRECWYIDMGTVDNSSSPASARRRALSESRQVPDRPSQ